MLTFFLAMMMLDARSTARATEELLKLEKAKLAPAPPVIVTPEPIVKSKAAHAWAPWPDQTQAILAGRPVTCFSYPAPRIPERETPTWLKFLVSFF